MVRLSWCVALIFACVALLSSNAVAERRVALVIGNSSYQHATPLENPKNDAADMAAKLQGLGFEVVRGVDLNLLALRGTVREFIRKLDGADIGACLPFAGMSASDAVDGSSAGIAMYQVYGVVAHII